MAHLISYRSRWTMQGLGALPKFAAVIAWTCMFGSVASVQAQTDWPTKPIRIIVPAPAGGVSDNLARLLAEQMAINLKQPVIVDNKAGGSGTIGFNALLATPPDGYTMLLGPSGLLTEVPHVIKTPFDPLKDSLQVAELIQTPLLLVANPAVPARTLEELIAYAKANPGKLSVASYSAGTRSHYAGAIFNRKAGIDLMHIPYKGSPPAVADLLGGQVPLAFEALPNVLKHIQAGKLKAFAILGLQRSALLPDVPTMGERGFQDVSLLAGWTGVYVSSKTPEALVARIHAEVTKAFATPRIKQALDGSGNEISPVTSLLEQKKAFNQSFERSAAIVKEFNIKAD